ncbi:MAG: rhomboid family intramembrane serine protease [Chitinophagaceae bacterium]
MIQLIAFSGLGFVAVRLVWITMIVYAVPQARAFALTFEYVGIADLPRIQERWWTIFTYAWCHRGFWEWLSNMLWLFCFGNVVQNLVGYKQIIPLFLYTTIMGGLAFTLTQLFPSALLPAGSLVMGAHAGIFGIMCAALTLSPSYRIYLSDYFGVPLAGLAALFTLLMLLSVPLTPANITMLLTAGLTGFVYVKLLQNGFQPGAWAYTVFHRMDRKLSPSEAPYKPKRIKSPQEEIIDRILDKINEHGYDSLSPDEKKQLREASR